MRKLSDICRTVRNGLALYGGLCLLGGITIDHVERKWTQILNKTEDRIHELMYGSPVKRPIEVEFKEVVE